MLEATEGRGEEEGGGAIQAHVAIQGAVPAPPRYRQQMQIPGQHQD